MCLLLVWVLWDCTVDAETRPFPDQAEEQLQAVVPVYRFMGCLILLVWCWGFNVWVWTKARINYMYAAPPCGACVCVYMCVGWRPPHPVLWHTRFLFESDHETSLSFTEVR